MSRDLLLELLNGCQDLREASARLTETVLNALMSAQADEACGADWGKRSEGRVNYRNGYRERSLSTTCGEPALQIPKLRKGSCFPDELLTRWGRADATPGTEKDDYSPFQSSSKAPSRRGSSFASSRNERYSCTFLTHSSSVSIPPSQLSIRMLGSSSHVTASYRRGCCSRNKEIGRSVAIVFHGLSSSDINLLNSVIPE